MADPVALEQALLRACEAAVREDGAQAIVIGGGPLAVAARAFLKSLGSDRLGSVQFPDLGSPARTQ